MTDLEKELLESRSNIYEKISKVEQDKLEGNSSIDTKALANEFLWDTSFVINVTAQPQYSISGHYKLDNLKDALDYQKGEEQLYYDDIEWDECPEDVFSEIDVDDIDVVVNDFQLKNPSKDYQEELVKRDKAKGRQELVKVLTRCFKHSAVNPEEFHTLVDEVIEQNPEFKQQVQGTK